MDLNIQSLKQSAKKTFNKGLTFFGVPANTILIFFGVLLLILQLAPLVTVIIDTLTVHLMETVPNAKYGDMTFYHYYSVFGSKTSWKDFYLPLINSLYLCYRFWWYSCLFNN